VLRKETGGETIIIIIIIIIIIRPLARTKDVNDRIDGLILRKSA